MNDSILEWQAKEHHYENRSTDWYWMFGIICVAAATLSIYFGNLLFGIFIIVAGFTIFILSYKETKIVTIKIMHEGVVFGNSLYPFSSYKSFWIDTDHVHGSRILMHPKNSLIPLTSVPVAEEIDLEDLHSLLSQFLEEEFLEESLIHKLFDKVGL